MTVIKPGMTVEIMEQGNWVGEFFVTAFSGRTSDHLVLRGPNGMFEIYNDAPFNIREVKTEEVISDREADQILLEAATEFLANDLPVGVEKPVEVCPKKYEYTTNKELIINFCIRNAMEVPNSFGDIEFIEHHDTGSNYRLHLPSGRVSDWNVHYEDATIVDMTEYNVVIG